MRWQYFFDNFATLVYIWLFGSFLGFLAFLASTTKDGGMIVICIFLGIVLVIATTGKLNSLGNFPDDRFMINAIYWFGSLGFGLVVFATRSSVGIPIAVLAHSFFTALVIAVMVWYITAIHVKQKALE